MTADAKTIVADAMRDARDVALDAAVEICEEIHKFGGCAQCCAVAISHLKSSLNKQLDSITAFDANTTKAH